MEKAFRAQTCLWGPHGIWRIKRKFVFWKTNILLSPSPSSPPNAVSVMTTTTCAQKEGTPGVLSKGQLKINASSWEKDIWILLGERQVQCLLQSSSGACKCKCVCVTLKKQQTAGATRVRGTRHSISYICLRVFLGMRKEKVS